MTKNIIPVRSQLTVIPQQALVVPVQTVADSLEGRTATDYFVLGE
jgi:hypothetical protein